MRILLIHNYLRSPSGENTVFDQERALLKSNGHQVYTYARKNDEINHWKMSDRLLLPFNLIWSIKSYRQIRLLIKSFTPDIAHFHNIFTLISPSAYYACHQNAIPVVQTIHNNRLVCPGGLLFRDGAICEECAGLNFFPGIEHGCYRNSRVQTGGMALVLYIHYLLKTWQNYVDAYIALSEFAVKEFEKLKFPAKNFLIKPNFLQKPIEPSSLDNEYGIFIGRLGEEKGINCLLHALHNSPEIQFKIVGDGPLKKNLSKRILKDSFKNIELLGLLDHQNCVDLLKSSRFLVLPSECYEGNPMALLEAMSAAKPAIVSDVGVLPSMVKDGVTGMVFKGGSVTDLTKKLKWMHNHQQKAAEMGKKARALFEKKYTPDKNYDLLMNIYQKAIEINRRRHDRKRP